MRTSSVCRSLIVVLLAIVFSGTSTLFAQGTSYALPEISVIGHGAASAPADTAALLITIGDVNYGGPAYPQPGGSTEERVAPIVSSLIDAGVSEEQVDVFTGPSITEVGTQFGPALAVIRVVLEDPERDQMIDLLDAVTTATANERLIVARIGVLYAVEDCLPLEREARELAVADARQQATVMAEVIGVTPGDIISSRDLPADPAQGAFGPYGPVMQTTTPLCGLEANPYAALLLPPFDPTGEPEVTVSVVLEVTFAVAADMQATPVP